MPVLGRFLQQECALSFWNFQIWEFQIKSLAGAPANGGASNWAKAFDRT